MKLKNNVSERIENPALSGFLIGKITKEPEVIQKIERNGETILVMGTTLAVDKIWVGDGSEEPKIQGTDMIPVHFTKGRGGTELIEPGAEIFVRGEVRNAKVPISECSEAERIAYPDKATRTAIYVQAKVVRHATHREDVKTHGFIRNNAFKNTGEVVQVIEHKQHKGSYPKVDMVVRFGNKHSDGREFRIPIACKKRVAEQMSDVKVGDIVSIDGRLESREFPKRVEIKDTGEKRRVMLTAYEVRAYSCKIVDHAPVED